MPKDHSINNLPPKSTDLGPSPGRGNGHWPIEYPNYPGSKGQEKSPVRVNPWIQ